MSAYGQAGEGRKGRGQSHSRRGFRLYSAENPPQARSVAAIAGGQERLSSHVYRPVGAGSKESVASGDLQHRHNPSSQAIGDSGRGSTRSRQDGKNKSCELEVDVTRLDPRHGSPDCPKGYAEELGTLRLALALGEPSLAGIHLWGYLSRKWHPFHSLQVTSTS